MDYGNLGIIPDATGRKGAAYYAGVSKAMDSYFNSLQRINQQRGDMALGVLGTTAQALMGVLNSSAERQANLEQLAVAREMKLQELSIQREQLRQQSLISEATAMKMRAESDKMELDNSRQEFLFSQEKANVRFNSVAPVFLQTVYKLVAEAGSEGPLPKNVDLKRLEAAFDDEYSKLRAENPQATIPQEFQDTVNQLRGVIRSRDMAKVGDYPPISRSLIGRALEDDSATDVSPLTSLSINQVAAIADSPDFSDEQRDKAKKYVELAKSAYALPPERLTPQAVAEKLGGDASSPRVKELSDWLARGRALGVTYDPTKPDTLDQSTVPTYEMVTMAANLGARGGATAGVPAPVGAGSQGGAPRAAQGVAGYQDMGTISSRLGTFLAPYHQELDELLRNASRNGTAVDPAAFKRIVDAGYGVARKASSMAPGLADQWRMVVSSMDDRLQTLNQQNIVGSGERTRAEITAAVANISSPFDTADIGSLEESVQAGQELYNRAVKDPKTPPGLLVPLRTALLSGQARLKEVSKIPVAGNMVAPGQVAAFYNSPLAYRDPTAQAQLVSLAVNGVPAEFTAEGSNELRAVRERLVSDVDSYMSGAVRSENDKSSAFWNLPAADQQAFALKYMAAKDVTLKAALADPANATRSALEVAREVYPNQAWVNRVGPEYSTLQKRLESGVLSGDAAAGKILSAEAGRTLGFSEDMRLRVLENGLRTEDFFFNAKKQAEGSGWRSAVFATGGSVLRTIDDVAPGLAGVVPHLGVATRNPSLGPLGVVERAVTPDLKGPEKDVQAREWAQLEVAAALTSSTSDQSAGRSAQALKSILTKAAALEGQKGYLVGTLNGSPEGKAMLMELKRLSSETTGTTAANFAYAYRLLSNELTGDPTIDERPFRGPTSSVTAESLYQWTLQPSTLFGTSQNIAPVSGGQTPAASGSIPYVPALPKQTSAAGVPTA